MGVAKSHNSFNGAIRDSTGYQQVSRQIFTLSLKTKTQ
jgi:hypothetical protein